MAVLLLNSLCSGALMKQLVVPLRILDGDEHDDGRIFGVDVFPSQLRMLVWSAPIIFATSFWNNFCASRRRRM